jgi:hypothetical protein
MWGTFNTAVGLPYAWKHYLLTTYDYEPVCAILNVVLGQDIDFEASLRTGVVVTEEQTTFMERLQSAAAERAMNTLLYPGSENELRSSLYLLYLRHPDFSETIAGLSADEIRKTTSVMMMLPPEATWETICRIVDEDIDMTLLGSFVVSE